MRLTVMGLALALLLAACGGSVEGEQEEEKAVPFRGCQPHVCDQTDPQNGVAQPTAVAPVS